jgi:hypothetical protein
MADIIIKKWNGTGWEEHYPKTTVGQIVASGTPSSTTFLRGDGTWSFVPIVTKADLTYTYVYGKAQSAITKGQAVQFAGVQGDHILMKPAVPSEINANPDYFIGLAETTLASEDFGYVLTHGELSGINTSSYTEGDILWFASAGSTAGALTQTEPTGLNARIQVAAVNRTNAGNGIIFVRVDNVGVQVQDIVAGGTASSTTFLRGDGTWSTVAGGGGDFLPLTGGTLSGLLTVSRDTKNHLILSGSTDTAKQMMMGYDVTNNYSYIQSVQQMVAYTDLIFNQDGGNVGIGTTSPGAKLDVNGTASVNKFIINDMGSVFTGPGLLFKRGSAQFQAHMSTSKFFLEQTSGGQGSGFVISTNNNIGIGVESPASKLHVSGTTISTDFRPTGSTNNGRIYADDWGIKVGTDSGHVWIGPANTGHAHIYTDRPNFYFNKDLLVNGSTVWHAGNDGSGSGLDADTLDGVQGTNYFRVDGTYPNNNMNVPVEGFWHIQSDGTGIPIPYYGHRWDYDHLNNGQWVAQFYSATGDTDSLWFRQIRNYATQPWQKLWSSTNDGSGSGLDADLLDGLQLHTDRNNEANKVVRTDVNGYIQAGWINTTSGGVGNWGDGVTRYYASGDGYIRYLDRNEIKQQLGLTGHYNADRRDFTTDANYFTGIMGWGTTDMNTVFNWGSGFFESWSNPANAPTGSGHWVGLQSLHYRDGSATKYGWQMVMNAGDSNETYIRGQWGSSPGAWRKIIHSGNIGSQSVNYASSAGSASSATSASTASSISAGGSTYIALYGSARWNFDSNNFTPSGSMSHNLGTSSFYWLRVSTCQIARNSEFALSDVYMKKDIKKIIIEGNPLYQPTSFPDVKITEQEKEFFEAVKTLFEKINIYTFDYKGREGSDPTNIGFMAQEIEEILKDYPMLVNLLVENSEEQIKDEEGNVKEIKTFKHLRVDNLDSLMAIMIKHIYFKVKDLEKAATKANEMINKIKNVLINKSIANEKEL